MSPGSALTLETQYPKMASFFKYIKSSWESFENRRTRIARRLRICESTDEKCYILNRVRDELWLDTNISLSCYLTLMLVTSLSYNNIVKSSKGNFAYKLSKYVHKYWIWDLFTFVSVSPMFMGWLAANLLYAILFYYCIYLVHKENPD